MKLAALFATLIMSGQAVADCPQPPAPLPNHMACVRTQCVSGSHCRVDDSGNILLENLNSRNPRFVYEEKDIRYSLAIQQSCENDRIRITGHDGEQTDELVFLKREVRGLAKGQLDVAKAIRTKGYWYADGDHTDSISVMECVVVD